MEILKRSFAARKPEGAPFCIMPLGDIQWTGRDEDVAIDLLIERIEYGLAHNAMFIGMGDYIDFASPSNRAALAAASIYDNARQVMEDSAIKLVDHLYDNILYRTKGRWLGLLEGHHFYTLSDGLTTDWLLARKLGCPLLGTTAFIRCEVTGRRPIVIWASHGMGSGQTVGALANKIDKQAQVHDADIYLMGHWTKQTATPIQRLAVDWDMSPPKLVDRTLHLVGTGGFSRGYVEGRKQGPVPRGSYVEQKLLRPVVLGNPLIRLEADGRIMVELGG